MTIRQKTDHPVVGLFLSAQRKPGWEFNPEDFGLPNFPLSFCAIAQHKKAAAISQHLMIGLMLGYVRHAQDECGQQLWHKVDQPQSDPGLRAPSTRVQITRNIASA